MFVVIDLTDGTVKVETDDVTEAKTQKNPSEEELARFATQLELIPIEQNRK